MESTTTTERIGSGADESNGQRLADEATTKAGAAAGAAKQEASSLANQARAQVGTLVSDAGSELRTQADQRASQAATRLRDLGDQVEALRAGRPEEAAQLHQYLGEGRDRVMALASRLDERGVQGVLDDVSSFGRRRPGTFLLAAAGVGFVVGRLARAGAFSASQSAQQPAHGAPQSTWSDTPAASPASGTWESLP